jgi:hypothetical protein
MLGTAKGPKVGRHPQDGVINRELDGLITKIVLALPLDRFDVFCECVLEASVWVRQGRLAKPDMVDRFMQAAEAYDLVADYGVDGIQNVLASTLREAAASVATVSNGHNIASTKDATLSALPALPAPPESRGDAEQGISGKWTEPDWTILDDRRGDLPEFPTDTFSAPWQDWLRRAARGAGATEGHVAVPLLGIVSSLIGTARRVRASSAWSEPCTMWTAVVGFSGAGKTPGIDVTKRALAQIEKDRAHKIADLQRQHEAQVEIAKAEHKKWQAAVTKAVEDGSEPPPMPSAAKTPAPFVAPRLYLSSVTIERIAMLLPARPSGLLMIVDELAGLFLNTSRYSGGQDDEFWLEAWNGSHYVVERVNRPSVTVDNLLVGITGGFQPDKLVRSFEGDADGMYARICFGWPEEPPYRPLTNDVAEIEPAIINALNRIINLSTEVGDTFKTACLPLSAPALSAFEAFRQQVHSQRVALVGREREWWAKAPTHVLRLAGTLSYLDWAMVGGDEPKSIEPDIMQAAIRLVGDYFWPHSRAALRQIGISQRHADARCVLLWIKAHNKNEISVQDARREALSQRLDAKETEALLDSLVAAGWLRKITVPTAGRHRVRWEVNPVLFVSAESAGSAERSGARRR